MRINLELGGVAIGICSERELLVSSAMAPFVQSDPVTPDVMLYLTWDWENSFHPVMSSVGEDLLLEYYYERDVWFCESKGGKAPVTCTCYKEDFSWMECAVNEKTFLEPPDSLEKIFRLLPMRAVFTHFKCLFLHASQVSINETGIVFSAPSGVGKTTQAKLWKRYMGADIVCNDRTLMRKKEGVWKTYGYPIDGSEPVRSAAINQLGCIVMLKQGPENRATRLGPGRAVRVLMEQAVLDCWNVQARVDVMELILEMLREIPVYELVCTPDERAVEELRNILVQEGVMTDGTDCKTSLG